MSVAVIERTQIGLRHTTLRDVATRVRVLVGLELTAYLAAADTVLEFATWLDKDDPVYGAEAARRLEMTLQLAGVFRKAQAVTRLRSWLREKDERLGGLCPAEIIRAADNESDLATLVASAGEYLRVTV